ncbi:ABC transporter permease [Cellulomonas endometrii]|uniref:ABC transporter permease n=1 Tax=Cellulomonas endometrii TaxID=3036301 RepID=UPI003D15A766
MSQATPAPDQPAGSTAPAPAPREDGLESRSQTALREMLSSSWLVTVAALVLALVISAVLIAAADSDVQDAATYFFARPMDFFSAAWDAVWGAYVALFQGAVFDPAAATFARAIRPITETMTWAVPLILAGLGLGIGFRAGMFNIGAQGQIILGAVFAGYIGFAWDLPPGLHLLLAVIGAMIGGGLWAGIAGYLKARTGANEVIVTIMLNNIAIYLVGYLLTTSAFKRGSSNNPISPPLKESALYPLLLGSQFRLHLGFVVAILAAVFVWWLMNRSTIGFAFRAVGSNPSAARTAGINVNRIYLVVMIVAGALAGMAGSAQVLGTEKVLTAGIAASFGFDAITVALLGRSKPLGTFFAGLLFGALRAGGFAMQARTGTPIDIVLVVQSLVVLFIAAPPLVRAVFRLPAPRGRAGAPAPELSAPVVKEAAA